MFNLLIVEDDTDLNKTVCEYLKTKGYETVGCLSAQDAYDEMYGKNFDLIISDIMMPGIDGFEFAETVRRLNENIPILFMTAREDFEAKQKGFMAGIDDFMVKPINLEELTLHVGALLRRAGIASTKRLEIGSLVMDTDEHIVTVKGEEVPLTQREFNIIFKLLSFPKKTFTRGQLMDEFWDVDSDATPRAVDVYMTKLRDKFEQLKALDRQAERRGQILSIAIGIIGTLVLGTGMSMVMVGQATYFVPGIVIGIAGTLALCAAYPIYKRVTKKDRDKVAGQVLALAKQIQ